MKFTNNPVVGNISGTSANSQLVMYKNGDGTVGRARTRPSNPRTTQQTLVRNFHKAANLKWEAVTHEVRDAWDAWAVAWRPFLAKPGNGGWPSGRNAFIAAVSRRLLMELPAVTSPPIPLPPPQILNAVELGSSTPSTFRFRITSPAVPPGEELRTPELAIFIRITPPTQRSSRRPYKCELRMACGVSPQSAAPLPPGAVAEIEFAGCQYDVPAGRRFGFELTPVRIADGVGGRPLFVDCKSRSAPEP